MDFFLGAASRLLSAIFQTGYILVQVI